MNAREWCDLARRIAAAESTGATRKVAHDHALKLTREMIEEASAEDAMRVFSLLKLLATSMSPWGRPRRGARRNSRWERLHGLTHNRIWKLQKGAAAQ